MKNLCLYTIILCFVSIHVSSQDPIAEKYAKLITPEHLEDHLTILASDALEGRATGTRGQKMAATFIASFFEELGLEAPVEGSYFQSVDLVQTTITGVSFNYGSGDSNTTNEIACFGNGFPMMEKSSEVIFAGYGSEADFNHLDVKNKFVLVYAKDTLNSTALSIIDRAIKKEATLIFIPGNKTYAEKMLQIFVGLYKTGIVSLRNNPPDYSIYGFVTTPSVGAKIMNTTPENLIKVANEFDRKYKKIKPATFSFSIETEEIQMNANNVLGLIEGTDKKDELIVISSHYDHMGIKGDEEDNIYNGADDNGSGTVAVMNLAKAFTEAKKNGNGTRRSILFAAVTAEEVGLFGSKYYTLNPVLPLDKTIANLNIDMIGRRDTLHNVNNSYVYLAGSVMLSSELHNISESANTTYTNLELDYTYNDPDHPEQFIKRSDQWNFMKNDIPVIFYLDGIHEDYHQPSDEIDKINFDLLTLRAQLVFYTAWDIANRENAIAPDKIEELGH